MTNGDRVQMLEALLERVRRNTSAARLAAGAPAEPVAHTATPAEPAPSAVTPPSPPVSAAPTAAPESPSQAPAAWQPEPGSSVQQRPGTLPPASLPAEEVSDDDLLEVTTIPPEPAEAPPAAASAAPEADLEPELIISEPPAGEMQDLDHDGTEVSEITAVGVRVAEVAASLDEAIVGAARLEDEALEGEHEVPIKTPPPESGPQEALPPTGLEAARTPDVDRLEADLISPPSMGPTAEQLGETIELEAPRGPTLEIDVALEESPATLEPAPAEELEVALPRPSMQSGLYDVTAPPPPQYPEPALGDGPPSVHEPREMATIPVELPAADSPERTVRPALGATDVARVALSHAASPKTFVELLDASLGA